MYKRQRTAPLVHGDEMLKERFEGGYVKSPQVGMHDWVVSFDLNSLYPNIIVQWNMSPETLNKDASYNKPNGVDYYMSTNQKHDDTYAIAANGSTAHDGTSTTGDSSCFASGK